MAVWDDDEEDSTPPTSPPQVARRGKFDDEEDSDEVLESWDAAEDSEVEREKEKKAAEAKAIATAKAAADKKSRAQRVEEHRNERLRKQLDDGDTWSDEDEGARLRAEERNGDLKHAEDLFGSIGISNERAASKSVNVADPNEANNTIDLSTLGIFNPETKKQFTTLGDTLAPLVGANSKKGHYVLFLQDFVKALCKDLPSDQIRKVSTVLTTLSNEKMKEEKLADKGGKKSKAAKTKTSLAVARDISYKADTTAYDDDGLDDGDFM